MTTDTKQPKFDELTAAAEAAVAELEALEPTAWTPEDERHGTPPPWKDAEAAATNATDALRTAAIAVLFPDRIVPVGADLWADLEAYAKDAFRRGEQMAQLHARAIDTHPELAALIRTPHVLDRVRREGAHVTRGDDGVQVDAFVTEVAEQLASAAEFEPAASILAETVPGLLARTRAAVDRVSSACVAVMHAELTDWFRSKKRVRIGREVFTGEDVVARIEAGDARFIKNARHYWQFHRAGGGQPTGGQAIFG